MVSTWLAVLGIALALLLLALALAARLKSEILNVTTLVSVPLLTPALLYALYYFHFYDDWLAFYEFRSMTGSEFAACFFGVPLGLFLSRYLRVDRSRSSRIAGFAGGLTFMMATLSIPFVKPLILPLTDDEFQDTWKDGVCLQSTPGTCGPCSAATLLKAMGQEIREIELAREAATSRTGTEIWYLARALRARGFGASFRSIEPTQELPVNAIIGVTTRTKPPFGHFIPILGRNGNAIIVGDPMIGSSTMTRAEFDSRYVFKGFVLQLGPRR